MVNDNELREAIQEAINAVDLICDSLLAVGVLSNDQDADFDAVLEIAGYSADNVSGILRDIKKAMSPEHDQQDRLDDISEIAKETGRMRSKYEVISNSNPILRDGDSSFFVLR